jgi:hypothetical protein
MKDFTTKQLLEWCNKHHAEGKTLSIHWDGGNDSGWVHFQIDGEECSEPEAEALVDLMYSELDYGSWAGDFSANGEASWDPEEKAFIGTDYYSQSEGTSSKANIEVRIPKYIPFDEMHINTDEKLNVTSEIMIINGFIHPETKFIELKLNETLSVKFSEAVDEALEKRGEEFSSGWFTYRIMRNDFKEDGDDLVATIDTIEYSVHDGHDNYVEINLNELLEEE